MIISISLSERTPKLQRKRKNGSRRSSKKLFARSVDRKTREL